MVDICVTCWSPISAVLLVKGNDGGNKQLMLCTERLWQGKEVKKMWFFPESLPVCPVSASEGSCWFITRWGHEKRMRVRKRRQEWKNMNGKKNRWRTPYFCLLIFHTNTPWLMLELLLSRTDLDQYNLLPTISHPTGEHTRMCGRGEHGRRFAG